MPTSASSVAWPQHDALLALLLTLDSSGAQALDVADGEVRAVRDGGTMRWPQGLDRPALPTVAQVHALVSEWATHDTSATAQARLDAVIAQRPVTIGRTVVLDRYRRLRFRLTVAPAWDGPSPDGTPGPGVSLSVRWLPLFPSSLNELGLGALLLERLTSLPHRGLVMLGAASGLGSTRLLNATLQRWAQSPHPPRGQARTHLLSRTHEQWFGAEHVNTSSGAGLVLQVIPGDTHDGVVRSLSGAARNGPDLIALDEVRAAEEMRHLVAMALTGHLALGTVHAPQGMAELFRRVRGGFDRADRDAAMERLDALRLLVWQGAVEGPDGSRVRVWEHLVFNDGVKAEIAATSPARLDAVLQDAMVQQGSDRLGDARDRLQSGRLDEDGFHAVRAAEAHRHGAWR